MFVAKLERVDVPLDHLVIRRVLGRVDPDRMLRRDDGVHQEVDLLLYEFLGRHVDAGAAALSMVLPTAGGGPRLRRRAALDLGQPLLGLVLDVARRGRREARGDGGRRACPEALHDVVDEIEVPDRSLRGAVLRLDELLERGRSREPDAAISVGLLERAGALLGDGVERLAEVVRGRQVRAPAALVRRVGARAEALERLPRPLRDRVRCERARPQVRLDRVCDELLSAKDRVHGRPQRLRLRRALAAGFLEVGSTVTHHGKSFPLSRAADGTGFRRRSQLGVSRTGNTFQERRAVSAGRRRGATAPRRRPRSGGDGRGDS